jgi:hypothetical protein
LHDGGAFGDSVKITDLAGQAVTKIEYDGSKTINGVEYFAYSLVDSKAGLADLAA